MGKCGDDGSANSKGNSWRPSGSRSWALELLGSNSKIGPKNHPIHWLSDIVKMNRIHALNSFKSKASKGSKRGAGRANNLILIYVQTTKK